jgi:hypothetical protein
MVLGFNTVAVTADGAVTTAGAGDALDTSVFGLLPEADALPEIRAGGAAVPGAETVLRPVALRPVAGVGETAGASVAGGFPPGVPCGLFGEPCEFTARLAAVAVPASTSAMASAVAQRQRPGVRNSRVGHQGAM